jgi:hypothetical protein
MSRPMTSNAAGTAPVKVRPEYYKGPQPPVERRRYRRFAMSLLGRFMRADKSESTCRLSNISLSGVNIACDVTPDLDERIVVHFEEIGLIEGTVVRVTPDGFAMTLTCTHRRRQKLAAQLTWLLNRHELAAADQRRPGHDRISVAPRPISIQMPDGTVYERNILDVSISGASIQTDMRPAIGTRLVVGRLQARVVRHHDRGVGVEFLHIQRFEPIQEEFA